ncbi:MAG: DUF1572 family protein [Bacteroidetes bacterium]|nr:DUF1572 family protein [Bacteroidota bacterium]
MVAYIKSILIRDLNKLQEELHLYKDTAEMWTLVPGTTNSAGNLALHLIGNLRHFIGNELGQSGYVRNRDEEFSSKGVAISEIDQLIQACIEEISKALDTTTPEILTQIFPKDVGGLKRDTEYVLLHLLAHFSYHLGQINYHRRMKSTNS